MLSAVKKTAGLLLPVVMLCMASAPVASAQALKFGFVDLARIFDESNRFQQVENELKSMQKTKAQVIEQKRSSLLDEMDEFRVQSELLPEDTVKQRQQELKSKEAAFFTEVRQEQMELDKLKQDRFDPLVKELRTIVEAIAKEEGYSFVFKSLYLAYGDPKYDITDKVIQRLNKK